MDENQFWVFIEEARRESEGKRKVFLGIVKDHLSTLEADEMIGFQSMINGLKWRAGRADLWGAAFILNGGCSDDGFDDFRGWLIAQGRAVYEAALENPDSLADIVPDDVQGDLNCQFEQMLNVALEPWKIKTGLTINDFYNQVFERTNEPVPEFGDLESWSTDGNADPSKCPALYPRLWAKLGW
jgi:Protein of unknown function (DUF4240)